MLFQLWFLLCLFNLVEEVCLLFYIVFCKIFTLLWWWCCRFWWARWSFWFLALATSAPRCIHTIGTLFVCFFVSLFGCFFLLVIRLILFLVFLFFLLSLTPAISSFPARTHAHVHLFVSLATLPRCDTATNIYMFTILLKEVCTNQLFSCRNGLLSKNPNRRAPPAASVNGGAEPVLNNASGADLSSQPLVPPKKHQWNFYKHLIVLYFFYIVCVFHVAEPVLENDLASQLLVLREK